MFNLSKLLVFSLCFLAGLEVVMGQEAKTSIQAIPPDKTAANLPKAGEVQAALKQWVLTRQLISKEQASWEVEKESLVNLNAVRQRETKQLAEFKKAAVSRIAEIDKTRKQFSEEKAELLSWRRELKIQIKGLEDALRPLIPLFPPPLRAKVEEAILRIETPDAESPLQHRTRDVLLVMQAALNFQNSITLDTDIRSINGEDRMVEVLYMGLTQAWYVDQSGEYSGYGVPGLKGWSWVEEPALAAPVRRAIAIQSRQATPAFVTLPLSNKAAASEGANK